MSIEQNIERIATALESLARQDFFVRTLDADAAAEVAKIDAAAADAPETPAEPDRTDIPPSTTATTVSIESLREAVRVFLKGFSNADGYTAAKAIFADFGAESATTLKPEHYNAFMARISA